MSEAKITLMREATITARHPVRQEVAELGDYWNGFGAFLQALQDTLAPHGLAIETFTTDCDEGHCLAPLRLRETALIRCSCCKEEIGELQNGVSISWYRLPSGRWEVVSYVS